jgi:phosphatidylserine decarboxylase
MTWHDTALDVLERLPQNAISRAVGRIVRTRLPGPLAQLSVSSFARIMKIDVGEAERPLNEYASVHDFFVRKLRAGARRIDPRPNVLVSPCDGVVGEFGRIDKGTLVQAKGRSYTLGAFVQDDARANALDGGTFITVYLSPRHYHRVHAPVAGAVEAADHIPGQLLPVNMRSINHFDGVFVRNERLAVWLRNAQGLTGVVLVGATCVGEMSAAFDDTLVTNRPVSGVVRHSYANVHLHKGAELGTFHMGSTVVVLVPFAPKIVVTIGQEVKMGEALLES